MSLLEDAKKADVGRKPKLLKDPKIIREQAELACAYFRGEISADQVRQALGKSEKASVSSLLAYFISRAFQYGVIDIQFIDED